MKALEMLKELQSSKVCKFFCKSRVDEAVEELRELSSRSCDNCKQFAKYENQDFGCCFGMARTVSKNFCCNKWESE